MDDNHSDAGSTVSASNAKMECPFCNEEFQSRAIFNHLNKKHPKDLLDSCINIKEAGNGNALQVLWFKKNDFDEEEGVTIYACLATNKSFMTEVKANAHFKKNKEALKEHTKEMKNLLKRVAEERKKKKHQTYPLLLKFREDKMNNSPSLARILWRSILFYEMGSKKILTEIDENYSSEKINNHVMSSHSFNKHLKTLREWIDQVKSKFVETNKLMSEKCLDVNILEPLSVYFEMFNNNIVPQLDRDLFDWLLCAGIRGSVRPQPSDYSEELYCIASELWPSVDF